MPMHTSPCVYVCKGGSIMGQILPSGVLSDSVLTVVSPYCTGVIVTARICENQVVWEVENSYLKCVLSEFDSDYAAVVTVFEEYFKCDTITYVHTQGCIYLITTGEGQVQGKFIITFTPEGVGNLAIITDGTNEVFDAMMTTIAPPDMLSGLVHLITRCFR